MAQRFAIPSRDKVFMISSIQSSVAITYHSLLRYTPFVPAITQDQGKWQVDESLLSKRVYIITTIALAIFATSIVFESMGIACISGMILLLCYTGAGDDLAGRKITDREIFRQNVRFPLDDPKKHLEDVDFHELLKLQQSLSDEEITRLFHNLKTKPSNNNRTWIDLVIPSNDWFSKEFLFCERMIKLGLFVKEDFFDLYKKYSFIPFNSNNQVKFLFLEALISLPPLSINLEEASILFLTDYSTGSMSLIRKCLEKNRIDYATFAAHHFALILHKYPKDARRIIFTLAWFQQQKSPSKILNVQHWMDQFSSKFLLRNQLEETLNAVNTQDIPLNRAIVYNSQAQIQIWLQTCSTLQDDHRRNLMQRAQFNDAFQPFDDASP